MNFDLSEDQRLLKDGVERLLAERYGFEQRKKYLAEARRLEPRAVAPLRRDGPARPALRRGATAAWAAARSRP